MMVLWNMIQAPTLIETEPPLHPRDAEDRVLDICVDVARGGRVHLDSEYLANVIWLASQVLRFQLPDAADRLVKAAERYFNHHQISRLPTPVVLQKGWVSTLPRLKDMLIFKLESP
jgi:hypothetical protein